MPVPAFDALDLVGVEPFKVLPPSVILPTDESVAAGVGVRLPVEVVDLDQRLVPDWESVRWPVRGFGVASYGFIEGQQIGNTFGIELIHENSMRFASDIEQCPKVDLSWDHDHHSNTGKHRDQRGRDNDS